MSLTTIDIFKLISQAVSVKTLDAKIEYFGFIEYLIANLNIPEHQQTVEEMNNLPRMDVYRCFINHCREKTIYQMTKLNLGCLVTAAKYE